MSYHIGNYVLFNAGGMWDNAKPQFVCEILDEKVSAYKANHPSAALAFINNV